MVMKRVKYPKRNLLGRECVLTLKIRSSSNSTKQRLNILCYTCLCIQYLNLCRSTDKTVKYWLSSVKFFRTFIGDASVL